MLDLNNIRFASFVQKTSEQFINTYSANTSYKSTYEGECKTVFRKIKELNLKSSERQKIGTQSGNWFCNNDAFDFTYLVLVSPQYSEALAYALIEEIKVVLHSLPNFNSENKDQLKSKTTKGLFQVCKKYEDPANVSSLHDAQKNVKDVTEMMKKNMVDLIDRGDKLDTLDMKSQDLEKNADELKANSKTVKKIMCRRNAKITILGIITTLIAIAIIVIVIVVKVK